MEKNIKTHTSEISAMKIHRILTTFLIMFQLLKSKFNNRAKVRKYIGCAYAFYIFFRIRFPASTKKRPFILMETLSEMQNDCKTIRKLEEKIGKEKYIVMNYNTDWNNKNLPSRA